MYIDIRRISLWLTLNKYLPTRSNNQVHVTIGKLFIRNYVFLYWLVVLHLMLICNWVYIQSYPFGSIRYLWHMLIRKIYEVYIFKVTVILQLMRNTKFWIIVQQPNLTKTHFFGKLNRGRYICTFNTDSLKKNGTFAIISFAHFECLRNH